MVGKNSREGHKEKIRVTADVPLPPFHSERNGECHVANGEREGTGGNCRLLEEMACQLEIAGLRNPKGIS